MEENSAETSSSNEHGIRLADCICPICMSILLEPITMPCSHELCRPCFRDTVEQVNFTCPLCRLRISNWARKQAKVNKLINWTKWKEIQAAFPEHVRKRLEGEDTDDVLQPVDPIRVCKPGEVRQEYEQQVKKHQIEREEQENIEKAKSQKVIREIQEEELRQYEQRRQEEERLRVLDEELARKLAGSEEPKLHEVGNLADEQARLDEQLARALQEEQSQQVMSQQTQKDEEFARKLQDELEKTSITSQNPSKRLTPRSKNTNKIPATNIERFFKKTQLGESSQSRPCSTSGDSSKDDLLPTIDVDFKHALDSKTEKTSPDISCSRLSISDVVNVDSNSDSPIFLGPSTSKVIGRADISLVCVEDYNDDLGMEFDENSNSTFKHEIADDDTVESVIEQESDVLCLFDECAVLETKDLTPSPMVVINLSPPTDVDDDETRSNQEEVVPKASGAFTPIAKTPPSGIPRKNALRSDSVGSTDSISHELSHFRPIVISPRTAARKLADGKTPTLVHSTPTNLQKALEKGEHEILQKSPLLMAKWLSLAKERETKVIVGSKSVMVGRSVIQNDAPGNSSSKNSSSPCHDSGNVNSTDEAKITNSVASLQQQLPNWISCESSKTKQEVADKTTAENIVQDTVKLSPGKVYRMKDKIPSHAKRKNLTKLWATMGENTDVPPTRCPAKDARMDKNILSKIVRQKEDKNRKVEEVKTGDIEYDDEVQENMEERIYQNDSIHNVDERCVKHFHDTEFKRKDACSDDHLADEDPIEECHIKHKDRPSGIHSEEKNVKKRNQTEEKGRRRRNHIDIIKDSKTIEDMFAKFKRNLGNVENSTVESKTDFARDEKVDDQSTRPSSTSPVQNHQVLILNQRLSFKRKGESGKLINPSEESSNKRKRNETTDGQCKLKFKVSSYSSPKKTQLLRLSPSPKKSSPKTTSKGKALTRNDSEPLSPGSIKHNRFVKLQTKEERRLHQEEMDRKVALKLQREINREMKAEINNVNRTRGSDSEYQLRSRKPIYKTAV